MIANNSKRIEVVDSLRGFALMIILLLHCIQHFDLDYIPEYLPEPIKVFDKIITNVFSYLFAGKAYAIFAFLFGFSFFIQNENQKNQGKDFRRRFLWRLLLLFCFGVFNTIFFAGDILMLYAVLGMVLVLVLNLKTKYVLCIAFFLLILPLEWYKIFNILYNPEYLISESNRSFYSNQTQLYLKEKTFINVVVGNLTTGRISSFLWNWETGKCFQTAGLFMLGMITGKKELFFSSEVNFAFWRKILRYGLLILTILLIFRMNVYFLFENKTLADSLMLIATSWANFIFTFVLISLFVLFYAKEKMYKILTKLVPYGKMSLTNYILQSILGSVLFYEYGFGLFKYTGATFSLLIGIVLFLIQLQFSNWWLKKYKQGPLEFIWHKLTWISFSSKS
ncbi:DUF418 domain-containing protein [Flavobacterium sp.]|uniref:DUF418 domain-containing protein n=1 Tax=Flavobacterium sp. TaxID=239 RepID=UPI0031D92C7B